MRRPESWRDVLSDLARDILAAGAVLLVLGLLATIANASMVRVAASPPPEAERYRRDLIRTARYVWGVNAPVAVLAAQVHQESGWDPNAKSAYANGLAQFTPATAQTIARQYPKTLGRAAPLDPGWALMALCRYDNDLWTGMAFAVNDRERWAFTLSAYNGGPGWVARDRAAARAKGLDNRRWWGQTERVNGGRATQFWTENRGYPRRILLDRQPLYRSWGPGIDMQGVSK